MKKADTNPTEETGVKFEFITDENTRKKAEDIANKATEVAGEAKAKAKEIYADTAPKIQAKAKASIDKLKEVAGEGWEDFNEEVSNFFSKNYKSILKQFAVAGIVFAVMMFLNVPALWSFLIAATGLTGYWLLLFKSVMLKKLGTKPSEAQVILYTIVGVFGLYNVFHLDMVHLAKWGYHLDTFGIDMPFTVNLIAFFAILSFFWYYSARYMAETSYQSLGKWKSISVASVFAIVIGVIVYNVFARAGLDGITVWYKPIILAVQVALAYVIYDSFGFAKRHFKRATIVSSDHVEGDTVNVENPGSNQVGDDADEFVQNEAAEEFTGN